MIVLKQFCTEFELYCLLFVHFYSNSFNTCLSYCGGKQTITMEDNRIFYIFIVEIIRAVKTLFR